MKKTEINFTVAGFRFKIIFEKTELQYIKKKLMKDIKAILTGFIYPNSNISVDFCIRLVENKRFKTCCIKKTNYIEFFTLENSKTARCSYQISVFQLEMIIRNFLLKALKDKGFILHSSANKKGNKSILFLGDSGAGKSTIMRLLDKKYPALADDSVIIKKEHKRFFLYQTPFIEKESWVKKNSNKYIIDKIFILKKASFFKIEKILDKKFIFQNLMKQLFTEKPYYKKQIYSIASFVKQIDEFYYLFFTKDQNKLFKFINKYGL